MCTHSLAVPRDIICIVSHGYKPNGFNNKKCGDSSSSAQEYVKTQKNEKNARNFYPMWHNAYYVTWVTWAHLPFTHPRGDSYRKKPNTINFTSTIKNKTEHPPASAWMLEHLAKQTFHEGNFFHSFPQVTETAAKQFIFLCLPSLWTAVPIPKPEKDRTRTKRAEPIRHSLRKTLESHSWQNSTSPVVLMELFNHSPSKCQVLQDGSNADYFQVVK